MEKIKIVYGYNPITLEFDGTRNANLCPVTQEEYLIPANSVEASPLEHKQGFAQIWQNGKWVYVVDERGKDVYSCETGEKCGYVNNLFGDVKEGQTTLIPESGKIWGGEGWVEPPAPKESELILLEISQLESQITPRRLREALLGTDNGWLANQDAIIADKRKGL